MSVKLQVAGRSLKDSEHILTKFSDLVDDFVPEKSLRYAFKSFY